jgi:hypothetical protein
MNTRSVIADIPSDEADAAYAASAWRFDAAAMATILAAERSKTRSTSQVEYDTTVRSAAPKRAETA